MVAFGEEGGVFGHGEGPGFGETLTAVERGSTGGSVDAVGCILMAVGVGKVDDDVAGGLVDVPIQPGRCGHHPAFRPTSLVREFVHIVDMDVGGLGSHGLQFSVILDREQAFSVPETVVVGVVGGDRSGRGENQSPYQQLSALGHAKAGAPGLDEQTASNKVNHDPHQNTGHHPRYRVKDVRNPRFTYTAQKVAVRIQFTEV